MSTHEDRQASFVLLVEDSPGDARLIVELLREAAEAPLRVDHVGTLAAGLTELRRRPHAALLDLGLPDSNGVDTLLRAHTSAPEVPIIVLTGQDDKALAVAAVEAGAQDYLIKGSVGGEALLRAIEYAVRRQALWSELERTAAELDAKNHELDAFTYSVSHDLKEPLRTIEAFSQFLLEDYASLLDQQGQDYLGRMAAASGRMKQMIEDLMLLSRTGRRPDEVARVDVSRVVADAVLALEAAIAEKGATVRVAPELPAVAGDRPRLEQIFGNLISNALKFNHGVPVVEVGLESAEEGRGTFFVRDNGLGIEGCYRDRIFEIFQRLHRREEFDGTGAGLAIVRRAVEALDGSVRVVSEPGAGSTFFVTLPLFAGPADAAAREEG